MAKKIEEMTNENAVIEKTEEAVAVAEDAVKDDAAKAESAEPEAKEAEVEADSKENAPAKASKTKKAAKKDAEEPAPEEVAEKKKDAPFGPVKTKKAKRPAAVSEKSGNDLLKKKRPRRYIDDGSKVFTQDAKTKYASEIKNVDPAMQRLVHARQTDSYLHTKVSGTRNDKEHGLCALCYYGDETKGEKVYQVLIPWELFTDTTDEELDKRNITRSIFLERRIGSVIDFIPEDFRRTDDSSGFSFIGNRRKAMAIACYENWFATDRDSTNDDPKFNVGSQIEARVVGKFPNAGLRVEIFGVEATIPISELSWIRIPRDLSTIREDVGDNIVVCITKLRREKNPLKVVFEASVKKTRPDPRSAAFDRVEIGDSLHGTISNILFKEDDISKSRIFVALDGGGEALCARFGPEQVRIGDKVAVRIGNKYITEDGEPRIEVKIKHVYNL